MHRDNSMTPSPRYTEKDLRDAFVKGGHSGAFHSRCQTPHSYEQEALKLYPDPPRVVRAFGYDYRYRDDILEYRSSASEIWRCCLSSLEDFVAVASLKDQPNEEEG